MDRDSFKNRLKLYKQAKEQNPLLKYYEFRELPSYADGVNGASLNDYYALLINAKRELAYQNSLNRAEPRVPLVGGDPNPQSRESFEAEKVANLNKLNTRINLLESLFNDVTSGGMMRVMNGKEYDKLVAARDTLARQQYCPTKGGAIGPSCIYTALDNYGEQYLDMSNKHFMENAGKNGFREVPINDARKGDIVIRTDDPHYHGMIFDGYDSTGRRLYNHSNGGTNAASIRKHAKYPATDDLLRAFTFTGTKADSLNWAKQFRGYADGTDEVITENFDGYTDAEIEDYIKRNKKNFSFTSKDEAIVRELMKKSKKPTFNNIKGGSNSKIDRDVNLVMNSMNEAAKNLDNFGNNAIKANLNQEQLRKDKWSEYKKGIDATMTAAELMSAGYLLGGAAKAHNLLPNTRIVNGLYASDKGLVIANTIGGIADGYLLLTDDSLLSKVENGTETLFNTAGAIGGTNIVRNSRLFGKYGNKIDNILDGAGIIASGYDALKGGYNLYDWLTSSKNNDYKSYADGTDNVIGPQTYEEWSADKHKFYPAIFDDYARDLSFELAKNDLLKMSSTLPGKTMANSVKPKPSAVDFVNNTWANENPNNVGFDERTQKYYPHASAEGGTPTIGPGFKVGVTKGMSMRRAKRGITRDEADEMLYDMFDGNMDAINQWFNGNNIIGPADTISPQIKLGLMDLKHQVGGLSGWRKLKKAVGKGDIKGIKKQSHVTWEDKEGKTHVDKRRNKIRENEYFYYDSEIPAGYANGTACVTLS